ncbi:LytTR family DNA-binding domain-containing protein [Reichenbachiella carrageenanivorans]|uniref:LytTR family DNA-binding domain-containing protein n=1 Tax=Reichenbachiella carrageenanivorans TaxID=2979869 RepID=A0ABY6D2J4_9BACT|nr:LytTR family DNA-binding domain-containing protein [Reichenbachiella carrageenanivorans]UXX79969.1 LytTR family DNA-binding domain-containing protein [Reichenbachiella carrageenanivorans]
MRIVLIDNDATVRENLNILINIYAPDLKIVGEASGVQEGLACIRANKPDLVLLDVEMNDGTGFDLLAMYGTLDFKLIFVTGHNEYAIKAFKYSAIDYLLKPVDPDELSKAIAKAQQAFDAQDQNLRVANLVQNQQSSCANQKIVLKDAETVYLVDVTDIIRCESETNYTKFYLIDGRMIMVSRTLKEFDQLLKGQSFFRAHQSHLINLHQFDRYEKKEGGMIYMKDGSTLPVAVRKKDALMSALADF